MAFRYVDGVIYEHLPSPDRSPSEGIAINEAGRSPVPIPGGQGDPPGVHLGRRADLARSRTWAALRDITDINAAGKVVGYAIKAAGVTRGYVFGDGQLVDLTTTDAARLRRVDPVRIEDQQTTGRSWPEPQTSRHRDRVLLLVPTNVPTGDAGPDDRHEPAGGGERRTLRAVREEVHARPIVRRGRGQRPGVIDVTATFRAPSGASYTVPAFFGTDYTFSPGRASADRRLYDPVAGTESGVWHARFSPDETGTWHYTLRAQRQATGQESTVVGPVMTFSVTASAAKGQVERDPRDDRFLRYADGTPYYPMGQNVAFGDGNPFNDGSHYYEPLLPVDAGGRPELDPRLDDRLLHHDAGVVGQRTWSGQYTGSGATPTFRPSASSRSWISPSSTAWRSSSCSTTTASSAAGSTPRGTRTRTTPPTAARSPAEDPAAFFSDPTAKQLFKQRLRYLVARYGAYRDILAWELFNETQFIGLRHENPFTQPAGPRRPRRLARRDGCLPADARPVRPPDHDQLRHRHERSRRSGPIRTSTSSRSTTTAR